LEIQTQVLLLYSYKDKIKLANWLEINAEDTLLFVMKFENLECGDKMSPDK